MPSQTARTYLLSKFTSSYNGLPAAKFESAGEFNNFLAGLSSNKIPHQTKIVKRKPKGRLFIAMKVGDPRGD